jgi:hypothetical protein
MKKPTTAPMKYLDRIRKSPEDQLSEEQEYQAEDNKSQLEADLKATSRDLVAKRRKLDSLKSAAVLSTHDIFMCEDAIEGLEKGVEKLNALIAELF